MWPEEVRYPLKLDSCGGEETLLIKQTGDRLARELTRVTRTCTWEPHISGGAGSTLSWAHLGPRRADVLGAGRSAEAQWSGAVLSWRWGLKGYLGGGLHCGQGPQSGSHWAFKGHRLPLAQNHPHTTEACHGWQAPNPAPGILTGRWWKQI